MINYLNSFKKWFGITWIFAKSALVGRKIDAANIQLHNWFLAHFGSFHYIYSFSYIKFIAGSCCSRPKFCYWTAISINQQSHEWLSYNTNVLNSISTVFIIIQERIGWITRQNQYSSTWLYILLFCRVSSRSPRMQQVYPNSSVVGPATVIRLPTRIDVLTTSTTVDPFDSA